MYPGFKKNDVVVCKGVEYLVLKVNAVNLRAKHLATGVEWNVPRSLATVVRHANSLELKDIETELKASFVLGSVVEFKGALFTIIGNWTDGTYKVAQLGGNHNKYYGKVSSNSLKAVSRKELADRLVKEIAMSGRF